MRDTEARLTELEIRYTHQARLLDELDGVVVEQRRVIERLVSEVARLRARLDAEADDGAPDEPPPHY
ncbi:MAG: SlyX family protein [Polyangiaceae bacterium]|nr:SlyX family protein [Polyangiaceae bacterium]